MADKTVTVKSADGDYTTLNAAFSGEDGATFDAFTGVLHIVCYNFEDTTLANQGTGFADTSATHYVSIEAYDSHGGKWSTSAYRLNGSPPLHGIVLNVRAGYSRITGLQLTSAVTANRYDLLSIDTGSSGYTVVDSCILKGPGASGATYTNGLYHNSYNLNVYNCIVYDFSSEEQNRGFGTGSSGTANFFNCTAVNCFIGFLREAGTCNATNCGCSGCSTGFSGTITQTTCSTSTPTFLDADNDDFHLASGDTTWKNQGTDLSGTFTTDIDGDTRPTGAGTWDIGADEYIAAGGSIVPLLLNQYRARRV
jgi:hypothetical protein